MSMRSKQISVVDKSVEFRVRKVLDDASIDGQMEEYVRCMSMLCEHWKKLTKRRNPDGKKGHEKGNNGLIKKVAKRGGSSLLKRSRRRGGDGKRRIKKLIKRGIDI